MKNTDSKAPLYSIRLKMISRCHNRRDRDWRLYGGRGVRVCARWRTSLAAFSEDMGPRPEGTTVDRKDTNGGYWCGRADCADCADCGPAKRPCNCRWATQTEQHRNRRNNHLLTHAGQTLCIAAWSERTGLHTRTIRKRVLLGWSDERTLTTGLMRPATRAPNRRNKTNEGVSCDDT